MNSSTVERFLRYVQIYTTSDPLTESQVPSTQRQFDLARLLAKELNEFGAQAVEVDEHAYVTATIPATPGQEDQPAIAFISHIDTSPDAPGENVSPRTITYEGGVYIINEKTGAKLDPTLEPILNTLKGQKLIITDGTTLLGADDKAGVAEIMGLAERLLSPGYEKAHSTIKLAFVPDEEIGHGASLLDIEKFGAAYGYTVDGGAIGELEYECFNAANVQVSVRGVMIHPGSAKDVMVNALTLIQELDSMLPAFERPEHTTGYEGFFHLMRMEGTVDKATSTYIIRDHDSKRFEERKKLVQQAADFINAKLGEKHVEVRIRDEYYNMAQQVEPHMHLIENAKEAFLANGITPRVSAIRGGTDGAQLSFRDLPCPNLSAGGMNFHSTSEFIPVESLNTMVDVLEAIVMRYSR